MICPSKQCFPKFSWWHYQYVLQSSVSQNLVGGITSDYYMCVTCFQEVSGSGGPQRYKGLGYDMYKAIKVVDSSFG